MRIAIVAGMEFCNHRFVRGFVRALPANTCTLILTSRNESCTVAAQVCKKTGLPVERISRCKPHHLIPSCDVLVLLYDGANQQKLLDFAKYATKHAPKTEIRLFGPEGPIEHALAFLLYQRATFRRGYGGFGNNGVPCGSSE
jgi:hypothetical protein